MVEKSQEKEKEESIINVTSIKNNVTSIKNIVTSIENNGNECICYKDHFYHINNNARK